MFALPLWPHSLGLYLVVKRMSPLKTVCVPKYESVSAIPLLSPLLKARIARARVVGSLGCTRQVWAQTWMAVLRSKDSIRKTDTLIAQLEQKVQIASLAGKYPSNSSDISAPASFRSIPNLPFPRCPSGPSIRPGFC
jgi:hypothetical protein